VEYNFYLVMAETRHFLPSNKNLTCKPGTIKTNRFKTPNYLISSMSAKKKKNPRSLSLFSHSLHILES
jgi:hypothetical protein